MVPTTTVTTEVRTAIFSEKTEASIQRALPKKAPNHLKVKPSGGKVR
jgi:hypothetical protein